MKTKRAGTKFTVADAVRDKTVKIIRRYCLRNYIDVKLSSRKEVFVQVAAKYILENVETILSRLMIWDLEIVRDLVKIGPRKALSVERSMPTYVQAALFLRSSYDEEKDCKWYVMSDDLREAIGSKAEELLADEEYHKKSESLQFLQGLKYIYGFISTWEARRIYETSYKEYSGNNENWRELMSSPNTIEDITFYEGDGKRGMLLCPMIHYFYYEIERLLPTPEEQIRARKEYTRQEILDAGRMPFPIFRFEQALRLKEYLKEDCGITDSWLIERSMFEFWIFSQPIYQNPTKGKDLLKGWWPDSQELLDKLAVLVDEFVDATPCWVLSGNPFNTAKRIE